jgi:quercetin dioxygenase-like cupin family protein
VATPIPPLADSALALSLLTLENESVDLDEPDLDSLLYVTAGSGKLTLEGETHALEPQTAALVVAGESASLAGGGLVVAHATVGREVDVHAALGPRDTVTRIDASLVQGALGKRGFQVLFGPHNGSTRATLFAGFLPPERAPWHYHLYDEIVFVPEGPGRLHRRGSDEEPLRAGSAFRLRPREVHIVENASDDREMAIIGVFTPAGSPSAAYLALT